MKHKKNLYYVRNAAVYYSQALAELCGNAELESVCYGNRAQANLVLGEYGLKQVSSIEESDFPL